MGRTAQRIVILIPVYDDWESLSKLLFYLDKLLRGRTEEFQLLLIDDGSNESPPTTLLKSSKLFSQSKLLRLRCNMGHQRAIGVGLAYLYHNGVPDGIVVMDGDGEDKPGDVPRLLDEFERHGGTKAVFAERTRRSEGFRFTFFYKLYQFGHRLITGMPVKIGNFSVLPGEFLSRLVISSHLWNHYAATVARSRLRWTTVPTTRGVRYRGTSKMNFVSLVRHGLSALAVHSEVIAVRLLVATGVACVVGITLLAACILIKLFTALAVPGWATYVSGFIAIILIQILSVAFSFSIHTLSNLNSMSFLPVRDFLYFIGDCKSLSTSIEPSSAAAKAGSSIYA